MTLDRDGCSLNANVVLLEDRAYNSHIFDSNSVHIE